MNKRLVLALTSLLFCVFSMIGSTVYYFQLQFESNRLSRGIEIALSRPDDSYQLRQNVGSYPYWSENLIPIILAAMTALVIFKVVHFLIGWKKQNIN